MNLFCLLEYPYSFFSSYFFLTLLISVFRSILMFFVIINVFYSHCIFLSWVRTNLSVCAILPTIFIQSSLYILYLRWITWYIVFNFLVLSVAFPSSSFEKFRKRSSLARKLLCYLLLLTYKWKLWHPLVSLPFCVIFSLFCFFLKILLQSWVSTSLLVVLSYFFLILSLWRCYCKHWNPLVSVFLCYFLLILFPLKILLQTLAPTSFLVVLCYFLLILSLLKILPLRLAPSSFLVWCSTDCR